MQRPSYPTDPADEVTLSTKTSQELLQLSPESDVCVSETASYLCAG